MAYIGVLSLFGVEGGGGGVPAVAATSTAVKGLLCNCYCGCC